VVLGALTVFSVSAYAFLVFAWVGWRRGNAALAGGILGALAAINLFFGAFLLLLVARRQWRAILVFSVCIVIMLLVSPFGWVYYFPFLLVPFAVIWRTSYLFCEGRMFRLLMATAWVLSTVPHAFVPGGRVLGDPLFVLGWASLYFYSLVLLLGLIATMQQRLQRVTVVA
jgi:hypothetical protein